jgi:hypothetical protein
MDLVLERIELRARRRAPITRRLRRPQRRPDRIATQPSPARQRLDRDAADEVLASQLGPPLHANQPLPPLARPESEGRRPLGRLRPRQGGSIFERRRGSVFNRRRHTTEGRHPHAARISPVAAMPMSDGRARGSWRQKAAHRNTSAVVLAGHDQSAVGRPPARATGAPRAARPVQDGSPAGFGLSVQPTQQRPGRACRQSRRRRRSRRSRSPPVAAVFPRLPPPGRRGVSPVSRWRAVRPGRYRARS